MPNPALSDQALQRQFTTDDLRPGWGATSSGFRTDRPGPPPGAATYAPEDRMTYGGAITATGVLLVLLIATAVVGWTSVQEVAIRQATDAPGWIFPVLLAAVGVGLLASFRPQWARILGPLYALGMGFAVGAISKIYNIYFDGIVLQAVAGTIGVFAVMLFLHAFRILRVTDRFRKIVFAATGAVFLVYMLNLVLRLFGTNLPFLHDTGPIGIGISLAVIVLAAFNLSIDFDFIERAVQAGAPKRTEWYAGFALLSTIVWLYLEILRLLSKLQSRR
jgi:uncharacterized YccA/Bax inhibitor family protein